MKKTLAFAGSNSSTSINHRLVKAIAHEFDSIDVIKLTDYDAVQYSKDIEQQEGIPESIQKLYDLIQQYESVIIATPSYNGMPPSFLKNIYDWLTRTGDNAYFMKGKKLAVFSTSEGEKGGVVAVESFRAALQYSGAHLVGSYSLGLFSKKINEADEFTHEKDKKTIKGIVNRLYE